MISSIAGVVFVGSIFYVVQPGSSFFSYHPALMALAYGIFMFNAIRSIKYTPSFLLRYMKKVTLHLILQVLGLICFLAGFWVIYYNKISQNKPHFISWHAKLGLWTILMTIGASIGGICANNPQIIKMRPLIIKSIHAFAGASTFLLASAATLTGLYTNYFQKLIGEYSEIVFMFLSIVIAMAVTILFQYIGSYYRRLIK